MRKTMGVMATVLLCALVMGTAVDAAQGFGAGYVDTNEAQILPGVTPTVTVSVPKPLIRLVTVAGGNLAPEVGELLNSVDHIQVKVYDRIEDGEQARIAASSFVKSLEGNAWLPMVQIEEGNDQVKVMLKTEGDVIAGLTAVITSGHELVFVNVSGNIDPEKTGMLISVIGEKYMSGTLLPPALMQALPGPHMQIHVQAPPAATTSAPMGDVSAIIEQQAVAADQSNW